MMLTIYLVIVAVLFALICRVEWKAGYRPWGWTFDQWCIVLLSCGSIVLAVLYLLLVWAFDDEDEGWWV